MRIGRGNWSYGRKNAPMPPYPPHIPRDVTFDETRAAAVGSRPRTVSDISLPAPQVVTGFNAGAMDTN
jgi:hypothetical protein